MDNVAASHGKNRPGSLQGSRRAADKKKQPAAASPAAATPAAASDAKQGAAGGTQTAGAETKP